MNEAIRNESETELQRVAGGVWPDQFKWLKDKMRGDGKRPKNLSQVLREAIDDAIQYEIERMQANS